ncbi:MAG: response regulator, partial [Methylococcaceae bacterium]|nr:response regulator [Methylococcaceae bacterium]
MRILIVDDDPTSLLVLSSILGKQGHETISARDGMEAYRLILEQQITLVISDWNMPGLDGLKLCQRIRAERLPHYVYFILLTGRDDRESLLAGMEAGADDFLVKPMDSQELLVRVRAGERILGLEHQLEERNQMLEKLNVELAKAYEIIKTDVNLAAEVQKSLLPKPQNWPGAKLNWLFIPSNFLAGDMFGYYPVDENHLAFFQLDVSGHGVSSALISFSFSKQFLQDRLGSIGAPGPGLPAAADEARTPPNEVIAALNRRFSSEPESWSFFLTMVYGIMDRSSGEIILSSAGHPQTLWWHQENGAISESKLSGIPIGVAPD